MLMYRSDEPPVFTAGIHFRSVPSSSTRRDLPLKVTAPFFSPAPAQGDPGQGEAPSQSARSQKANESIHQRPSAREKDMNVILESLNETQSQLND